MYVDIIIHITNTRHLVFISFLFKIIIYIIIYTVRIISEVSCSLLHLVDWSMMSSLPHILLVCDLEFLTNLKITSKAMCYVISIICFPM